MTTTNDSIETILLNALSSDKATNSTAMNLLEKMAKENFSSFLQQLGSILSTETKDTKIRQLSAILMKNSLIHIDALQQEWKTKLSLEQKNQIKMLVLSSLASGLREIRSVASSVIASICKVDQPIIQHWPDLIPSLTQNAFNQNMNLRLAAIETLGYVCEEVSLKGIDTASVDSILSAIIKNLSDKTIDVTVVSQCLKALFHTIKLAEKNFSTESEMKVIMEGIFSIGQQYQTNDDILDKIAMLFIEMFSVSSYYDYLSVYIDKILEFSFHMIHTKFATNERLGLLGLEILCTIGDEELSREPNDKIRILTSSQGLSVEKPKSQSRKYFNKIWLQLKELIIKCVSMPTVDEDDSEWNLSKGCLYILSIMVKVIDSSNIKEFLKQLANQINSLDITDFDNKAKCWLLLGSTLSSTYKDDIVRIINQNFYSIVKDIDLQADAKLQKSATFCLEKITQYYVKTIDTNKLDVIITKILPCLGSTDNTVANNVCSILENVIKAFGDKPTNKSSNSISGYFTNILQALFVPVTKEAVAGTDLKLSLHRLMTIEKLIDYSSHDKQEAVYQILVKYLQEIEISQTKMDELMANGANKERIYQIQDYYYTLLRTIFIKYKIPLQPALGNNIWILTKSIFTSRKTVFEEANLALGALAINMKQNFTPIFTDYLPFLDFSIKSTSITSLSKSGLSTLLNTIRSIDKGICSSSEAVIKTLIEICTSADVARGNKTIAITCLGEIAMMIEGQFEKYLSSVMSLLFSACEMGTNIGEDADEDTIEFVKDLRFEIIQTFTCIQFAMEEKKNLLVPFIPTIFTFFKNIVNDDKCQRHDVLKSMLSFIIDTITFFGKEIKAVCDEQFASTIITKLKAYNIPQYQTEIEAQEQVLKILFSN